MTLLTSESALEVHAVVTEEKVTLSRPFFVDRFPCKHDSSRSRRALGGGDTTLTGTDEVKQPSQVLSDDSSLSLPDS